MTPSMIMQEAKNPKALVVFAHGAGADKSSSFMDQFSELLLAQHISVLRFNFPYMDKRLADGKRRPPERMPKLLSCYIDLINGLESTLPLFIGGKSMGSRVAATITSEEALPEQRSLTKTIAGTFCLGYPFHPPGKPENTRLAPLAERSAPILVVQGDRDKLGDKNDVASYVLSDSTQLKWLADGDHDLKPRVKSGFTHQQHLTSAAREVAAFIERVINEQG